MLLVRYRWLQCYDGEEKFCLHKPPAENPKSSAAQVCVPLSTAVSKQHSWDTPSQPWIFAFPFPQLVLTQCPSPLGVCKDLQPYQSLTLTQMLRTPWLWLLFTRTPAVGWTKAPPSAKQRSAKMLWCWNPAHAQWSHEQTVSSVSNAISARIQQDQQAVSAGHVCFFSFAPSFPEWRGLKKSLHQTNDCLQSV